LRISVHCNHDQVHCSLGSLSSMPVLPAIANALYFDEDAYKAKCQRTPTKDLLKKIRVKDRQTLYCAGGIGAGLVASFLTCGVSIIGCVFSARHVNVLRQQIKIMDGIIKNRELSHYLAVAPVDHHANGRIYPDLCNPRHTRPQSGPICDAPRRDPHGYPPSYINTEKSGDEKSGDLPDYTSTCTLARIVLES
ncbi:hypothetical protein FRB91_006186, partial [Serendipita sp. 411]